MKELFGAGGSGGFTRVGAWYFPRGRMFNRAR